MYKEKTPRYVGHWLAIRCYKHDGSLHRVWDRGLVLENNDDYIVIATKRAKVTEYNGRKWFTKEPAVTIFSKKEWWNVICMLKKDGICYYCNIASPAIIEDGNIKYIDYDLDTKLFPDGNIRVLDEKEYARHRSTYQYDDKLDLILKHQTKTMLFMMQNRMFPFDDALITNYYEEYSELTRKKDHE